MGASISLAITQNSQSVANNTSNVTVAVQVHWTSGTWNALGECYGSITIDGTPYSFSGIIFNASHTTSGSQEVMRKTVDVSHNSDGTKTLSCSASFATCTQYGGTPTTSGSKILTTIPRQAKITGAPDFTDIQNPTISYSNPAGNAVEALDACISFTGEKDDIIYRAISKTGSSYTFPLTEEERNILRANTPGKTRTVIFYVRTIIGGDYYYSTMEKTLTIADDNVNRPSVTMSLSVVGSLPSTFAGLYIQGKTGVKMDVRSTAKIGASIQYHSYRVDGIWCDQIYYLNQYGDIQVDGFAVDSRDHIGSTAQHITVHPYFKPKLTVNVCERCDASGNLSDGGTYLKIKATRSYCPVISNNKHLNYCHIQYRYKTAAASSYSDWKTILPASDLTEEQVETAALLDGELNADTSYVVQIQAIDDIGDSSTTTITIPTEAVYMHRTKNGMGLGKYCEGENILDTNWSARFTNVNGLYFHCATLSGSTDIRIKGEFPDWDPKGTSRQSYFVFGSANGADVQGVFIVHNTGSILADTVTNCSASCEEAGVVKLTMHVVSWDQFVIMSARPFAILSN